MVCPLYGRPVRSFVWVSSASFVNALIFGVGWLLNRCSRRFQGSFSRLVMMIVGNSGADQRTLYDGILPGPPSQPRLISSRHTSLDEGNHQKLIAQHYSARSNRTAQEREASPIIYLKMLHSWVKSMLIHSYTRRGDSVLDLACGKGGDLVKWAKAGIGYYVGADIAEGSIERARKRYIDEITDHTRIFSFPARLICVDCFGRVSLHEALKGDGPFDICSCQFAMHYSWSSEERARFALGNVAALLKPGGYFIGTMPDADVILRKLQEVEGLEFGNGVYNVKFDDSHHEKKFNWSQPFGLKYEFHLEDAVDHCPEWLVPFSEFKTVAEEYGLELVYKKNFHEFVHEHMQAQDLAGLMRGLGARDTISTDEWDCASIYLAFVFRRKPRD